LPKACPPQPEGWQLAARTGDPLEPASIIIWLGGYRLFDHWEADGEKAWTLPAHILQDEGHGFCCHFIHRLEDREVEVFHDFEMQTHARVNAGTDPARFDYNSYLL